MLPARAGVVSLAILAVTAACGRPAPPPAPIVSWRTCADATSQITCGSIRVPEHRAAGSGRTIDIAFDVSRATAATPRAEPVFALAGGPGDASTSMRDAVARNWQDVTAVRDVVLVDQRGTGGSSPLHCAMNAAADPASTFGHIFDRALFARCRATLAVDHDLSAYTTVNAADDLDDVRAALGYDKILLWGGSYGTRLAQAYLQRHGDRVGLAILDSVAPIDVAIIGRYPSHLRAATDAIPEIREPMERIALRLRTAPAHTTVVDDTGRAIPVTLTLGDFAYAIRGILYGARGSTELPPMLRTAEASNDLSALAQRYWTRAARMDRQLAHGLHLSVLCSEDVPFISADDDRAAAATIGGRYFIDEYRDACRIWNVTPARPATPLPRTMPALLLSGQFDPVTPPAMAAVTAAWLPNARQAVAAGAGHGVSFGCARDAVVAALRQGALDPLPPVCGAR